VEHITANNGSSVWPKHCCDFFKTRREKSKEQIKDE